MFRLKQEYEEVSRQLETKLRSLEGAKEKEAVQNRANVLATSVNDKVKELEGKLWISVMDFETFCGYINSNIIPILFPNFQTWKRNMRSTRGGQMI